MRERPSVVRGVLLRAVGRATGRVLRVLRVVVGRVGFVRVVRDGVLRAVRVGGGCVGVWRAVVLPLSSRFGIVFASSSRVGVVFVTCRGAEQSTC